jgi:tetratricopeptide (TPR) repeat protein
MNPPRSSHLHVVPAASADAAELPAAPEPDISVRCHRRLRGPYSGGGALLRDHVVPELLEHAADLVAPRAIEIIALAPELAPRVPAPPWTLTEHAEGLERTRYYAASRSRRLAHGIAELLTDWAAACHPDGVVVEFRDLDHADPTDLELIGILLRRSDPALLMLVITGAVAAGDPYVGPALAAGTRRVAGGQISRPQWAPGMDLAQVFIDSDGTDPDPALQQAYAGLPPGERARRHTARADELIARQEPTLLLGAVPYHVEHGVDPTGTGAETIYQGVIRCLQLGFYEAALHLALRGRRLTQAEQPRYVAFTHKIGACLAYLDRGAEALGYFAEQRRIDVDAEVHMGAAYMLSMLYTRHLPKADRDEDAALEWVNTAIALADQHPDENQRTFRGAFMRNARALVELHRGNLQGALALVDEAARRMDAAYGPTEHQLHRSVLKYNRGLVLAALGEHDEALAAFDDVIAADSEYADYYFERAGLRRDCGWYEGAFEDYDRAVRLSPPFFEVYVNRADMMRELGDDNAALRDLDYALELEPDQVDSLINRAGILLAQGETERSAADVRHGLTVDPGNAHLLFAWGELQAEAGDTDGAWASYSAALREDAGFVAAWANRAVLAYLLGRTAEAIDDLDHAIRLADDPLLRVNRAIALQELGDHPRALTDLDSVLAGGGVADPELLYRRGASRHATGDIAGACADWRAHLAAYGAADPSPHLDEIRRQEADLHPGGPVSKVLA